MVMKPEPLVAAIEALAGPKGPSRTAWVALLTFPPGAASGSHSSLDPELGIVVDGELTLITPAGREVLGPGAVRWLPGLTVHDARNEGARTLKLWVIIFKK